MCRISQQKGAVCKVPGGGSGAVCFRNASPFCPMPELCCMRCRRTVVCVMCAQEQLRTGCLSLNQNGNAITRCRWSSPGGVFCLSLVYLHWPRMHTLPPQKFMTIPIGVWNVSSIAVPRAANLVHHAQCPGLVTISDKGHAVGKEAGD